MLKKLKLGPHNKKQLLIGMLIIVIVLVGGGLALNAKHNADKRKSQTKHRSSADRDIRKDKKPTTYKLVSAEVTCKQVAPTPGATTTITTCDGNATLTNNDTKRTTKYKVISATSLYKNGEPQSLDQLPALPAGTVFTQTAFMDKQTLGYLVYLQ